MPRRTQVMTLLLSAALATAAATGVASATDPTLDPTFGTGGVVTLAPGPYASFGAVLLLPDGRILVGGQANTKGFVLARYLANGTLDPTFGTGGVTTQTIGVGGAYVSGLALQGTRIIVGGTTLDAASAPVATVARFTYGGALDTTFAGGAGWLQESSAISRNGGEVAIQPDDKILVGAASAGADSGTLILRYGKDGGLDPTFDGDGAARTNNIGACGTDAQSGVGSVALTGAGLITSAVCGGKNGRTQRAALMRFRTGSTPSDGALDMTFGSGGVSTFTVTPGTPTFPTGMAVQPDGKILQELQDGYGGEATSGLAAVRWNADGTLDPAFGIGGLSPRFGFGGQPGSSEGGPAVGADGRVYLSGTVQPQTGGIGVARLSATGTLDPLWGAGGLFLQPFGEPAGPMDVSSEAMRLAVQSDGKVLAVGFAKQGATHVGLLMRFIPPPDPRPPAPQPPATQPQAGAVKARLRFTDIVALPSAKRCVSRRAFRIRLRRRGGVTYRSASVTVNGRRVTVVKGRRLTAPVDLRGLPAGRVVVQVSVTLADGTKLTGKRTYKTCAARRRR